MDDFEEDSINTISSSTDLSLKTRERILENEMRSFKNRGFHEGYEDGKKAVIQESFDAGYQKAFEQNFILSTLKGASHASNTSYKLKRPTSTASTSTPISTSLSSTCSDVVNLNKDLLEQSSGTNSVAGIKITSETNQEKCETEVILIDDDDDDDDDNDNSLIRKLKSSKTRQASSASKTKRRSTSRATPAKIIEDGIIGMKVRSPTNGRSN